MSDYVVDDMTEDDLSLIGWSGDALHIRSMATQLERVARGEVEYLVVRAPGGEPVAKGGIDYEATPGAGTIWQVATHPGLRGRGIGTLLIAAAEERIVRRGLRQAVLSVELDNPDARRLYERLGYSEVGQRETGWETTLADGSRGWYATAVADLVKPL